MMDEKLLPCPFCGGEALLGYDNHNQTAYWAQCSDCGIATLESFHKEEIIQLWNARVEKTCRWKPGREDWSGRVHFCTSCDDEWWLDCDNPEDAGYHYCPNCGGKIEVEK